MNISTRAIEANGVIDRHRQLQLEEPLPITGPTRVRVIILVPDDGDIDEME